MANNIYDLTQGNISKHFIRLIIPLIAGNVLQQLYNTVDAFVIGRFAGENEFAAVGVASTIMNLFLFAIVGSCVGVSVIFAQLYGAKDMAAFRREHFISLTSGLAITVVAAILGMCLINPIMSIIQTPSAITGYTHQYLTIVLIALPASYVYNLYSAVFRSVGRPRAALLILAITVVVNLTLDLLLIGYFDMGIKGAAISTACAQVLSAAMCLCYMWRVLGDLVFRKVDCVFDQVLLKRTIHYGFVTGLQQTGLYIGKFLVQGAVNTGGVSMISAYTATTRIEGFINAFGDSGAAVVSVLTAQNIGANNVTRVRSSVNTSAVILGVLGIFSSLLLFISARPAVALMLNVDSGSSYESACLYMQIVAAFYILNYTGGVFAGYFDGSGKVSITMFGTIGQISFRVVVSWILVAIGMFTLPTLAVVTAVGWLIINVVWFWIYRRVVEK